MKRFTVTAKFKEEIEIDDRAEEGDFEWGVAQTFHDREDGRRPFSHEMALRGFGETVESMARTATSGITSRICGKYPGAAQKHYLIEAKLPEAKVLRVEQEPEVKVIAEGDEKKCPNAMKLEKLGKALTVFLLSPMTRAILEGSDPKAVEQAERAMVAALGLDWQSEMTGGEGR